MAPSNFVPTINEGVETYGTTWLGRNEYANPQQRYDVELIKDRKRYHNSILYCSYFCYRVEIEAEVRVHVDELMREELKNLKLVSKSSKNDRVSVSVVGHRERQGQREEGQEKRKEGKEGKERKEKEGRERLDTRQVHWSCDQYCHTSSGL